MYQFFENAEVSFDSLKRLSIGKDIETGSNSFIFFETADGWYQVYLDSQVLFIQAIDNSDSISSYFGDLDQIIVVDINTNNLEILKIRYYLNDHELLFESSFLSASFVINKDHFVSMELKY